MTRMATRDSHGRADIGAAALALVAQISAASRSVDHRLDVHDSDSFPARAVRLLRQPFQILRIARKKHDRSRLGHRHDSNQRIERTPVACQPDAAKQFARRARLLCVDRDDPDPGQRMVNRGIARSAAEHLSERGCRDDNGRVSSMSQLGAG